MKKTVIVSGGSLDETFVLAFLRAHTFEYKIGVDHGIEFLKEHGLIPTHIVGDFDSAKAEALAYFQENPAIQITRCQPEKDLTDTQIAVEKALELGSQEIWILGGTGTRIDHMLANIRILNCAKKEGVPCFLVDKNNKIYLAQEHTKIEKAKQFGKYISLLALGGPVSGITLRGFKYPLTDYHMTGVDPIGVSNEILADIADISFTSGTLLVVESRD